MIRSTVSVSSFVFTIPELLMNFFTHLLYFKIDVVRRFEVSLSQLVTELSKRTYRVVIEFDSERSGCLERYCYLYRI